MLLGGLLDLHKRSGYYWHAVLRQFFLAFQAPGFRWLWLNTLFTSVAFVVESLGQGWLVLQLTDSPFWVGVAAGLRGAGQFLFSVPGGAIADRLDHRRLLLAAQTVAALKALALAVLVFTDLIQLWHVLVFVTLAGPVTAASQPAARALEYDVVGRERLLNAGAFRFLGGSSVQIVGALAGGFVIDRLGVGGNYALSFGAFMGAAGCLTLLRSPSHLVRSSETFVQSIKAGLRYSLGTPSVRRLLLLSLMTEFFGFSYLSMMPVMARDVLKVGPTGFGYLTAMRGAGQLAAMLVVASLGDFRNKGLLLIGSAFGFGLFVVLFGLSPWFPLSLFLVAVAAGMSSTYDSTMNTMLQSVVSGDMRGRVLGLYVSTWGLNQVGGFGAGAIATLLSVPVALAIGGGVVAANALRLLSSVRVLDRSGRAGKAS